MRLSRRSLGFVTAALLLACAAPSAQAQPTSGYPNKLVRIVVPSPPGGPPDQIARIIANKLQTALGQTVIVENRAGVGGMVGTGLCRQDAAGRLHRADHHGVAHRHSGVHAQHALRRGEGFHARHPAGGELRPGARRAALAAGEDRAGTGGAGAQAAGQAQLRPGRARNGEPHPGGGDARRRRHRHAAGALQGHAGRHDRLAGRPHRHVLHRHPDRAAAGAGGQAARARGDRQGALEGHARRADHAGAGLQGLQHGQLVRRLAAGGRAAGDRGAAAHRDRAGSEGAGRAEGIRYAGPARRGIEPGRLRALRGQGGGGRLEIARRIEGRKK